MEDGLADRLSRIVNQDDQRTLIGTFAHGLLRGPIEGEGTAKDLGKLAVELGEVGLDALVMSPGLLRANADLFNDTSTLGKIVCLEWTNSFIDIPFGHARTEGRSALLGSVEDALRLGADGIMTYIFLGWDDAEAEAEHMARNAILLRECERLGVVRIIEAMVRGRDVTTESEVLAHNVAAAARVAAEIGCDFVKVEWPGSESQLAEVIEGCPVPIVVAGGATTPPETLLSMVQGVMRAGADGLVIGRNIVQATRSDLVRDLRRIVHAVSA